MGLEYDISEVEAKENSEDLRLELAPRNQCRHYVAGNGGKAVLVSKEEFDRNYREKEFSDGPFKDNFGDGYGGPYNPNRQVFGKLKSGLIVYCELSESFQEKSKKLLGLSDNQE